MDPEKTQHVLGTSGQKNDFWRGWDIYLDNENYINMRLINVLPTNLIHVKSSIVVRFGHLTNRPRVYAEVAYSASEFGDISYYPGPDLGSQSDGLVELADVVTATAALSGIVF